MVIRVGETEVLRTYPCDKFNLITDYSSTGDISFESKNNDIATVTQLGNNGEIEANRVGVTHIVVRKGQPTDPDYVSSVCIVRVINDNALTAPMIAAGNGHVIALRADQSVWGWGLNTVGQVGNGGVTNVYEPVRIEALDDKDIIAVHAGEYHSIALSRDGRVYTWGANEKGQLGVGGGTIVRTPTLVSGIPKIKAISAGTKHTILLGVDGYVYSFGDNEEQR